MTICWQGLSSRSFPRTGRGAYLADPCRALGMCGWGVRTPPLPGPLALPPARTHPGRHSLTIPLTSPINADDLAQAEFSEPREHPELTWVCGASRAGARFIPHHPICPASLAGSMTQRTCKNRYKVTSTRQPGRPGQPESRKTGAGVRGPAQVISRRAAPGAQEWTGRVYSRRMLLPRREMSVP